MLLAAGCHSNPTGFLAREILAPNLYLQINIVASFRDVRLEVSG